MIFDKEKVYIAFYKGNDKFLDKIITWTSRGIYSHVEIIIDGISYSSSGRDGGIRKKVTSFMSYDNPNKWDIFELKVDDVELFKEKFEILKSKKIFGNIDFQRHHKSDKNGKYDYWSIILYHILRIPLVRKIDSTRFLCTEFILEIIQVGLSIKSDTNLKNTTSRLLHKAFDCGFKTTPTNVLELLTSLGYIDKKVSIEEVEKHDK